MDRDEAVDRVGKFFALSQDQVVCAYVFGSTGRGEARAASDVDVAVLLAVEPEPTLSGAGLGLEGDLEHALGQPTDLAILNNAPVDLIHRVLRDGVLAYEADPCARIRFEVRARNEYFDLRPILDRYRRAGEMGEMGNGRR